MSVAAATAAPTAEARLRDGGPEAVAAAARAVADRIAPRADGADRDGRFSHANVAELWREGLGNLALPAALGGVGAGLQRTAAAVRQVAAGDASTALVWALHLLQLRLLGDPAVDWPPALRETIVADTLAGPALINALRVEPDLGTPARCGVPATRARRTTAADGAPAWSISGRKLFCTGSAGLRWLAVWAATGEPGDAPPRAGTFFVPASAPGVRIVETWDHLGLRATESHDIVLEDVVVPEHHALGLAPVGADSPLRQGDLAAWNAALLSAVYLGVADAARDWLAGHLNRRVPSNLGAPLASLPRFQAEVGEIEAELLAAGAVLAALAAAADGGDRGARAAAARDAGLTKTVVTRAALAAVRRAVAAVGNAGLTRANPLQRHLRDAQCGPVHTPQDDTVLQAAGRAVLASSPTANPQGH
jgi:alkylation response protein AidB-like acyl-CoA dehydrogenase